MKLKEPNNMDLKEQVNPFIREQFIEVFVKSSTSRMTEVNKLPTAGEIVTNPEVVGITKPYVIDKAKVVTIYKNTDMLKVKMFMTGNSLKLLTYISETLQYDQDNFKLSGKKQNSFMELSNIKSRSTFYKAVEELIRYGFIIPTGKQGHYWINPFRFFSGNRLKKYSDRLKQVN